MLSWDGTSVIPLDTAMAIVDILRAERGRAVCIILFTFIPSSFYIYIYIYIDCISGHCVRIYKWNVLLVSKVCTNILNPRTNTFAEIYQSNSGIYHGFLSLVNFTIIRDWILHITNMINCCYNLREPFFYELTNIIMCNYILWVWDITVYGLRNKAIPLIFGPKTLGSFMSK